MEIIKETESVIINWLESDTNKICIVKRYERKYGYIKIPLKEGYDIIYLSKSIEQDYLPLQEGLSYQGFYEKTKRKLYDAQYELASMLSDEYYCNQSYSSMKSQFEAEVKEKVEEIVSAFESNIKLNKETEKFQERYRESAKRQARGIYLKNGKTDFKYECPYEVQSFENIMLEYVSTREKLVKETAEIYCRDKHESIVGDILLNLMTKEIIEELETGKDEHLVCMKKIMNAVPSECRMVNVTTIIDGKEMTFKYDAGQLRSDCGSHYYTWHIPAKERNEFENLYGRHADFAPLSIEKITYGKKTLYEKG